MRYGHLTRAILEHLAEAGTLMLGAFFPPHPKARLARMLLGMDAHRPRSRVTAKHTLSSTLYRLRKDGLVTKNGTDRKSQWTITAKGRALLTRKVLRKSPNPLEYPILPPMDGIVRLVSFDIPEKQRAKRDWLRKELIACDYHILHRSVFIGARLLPEELINAMAHLGITRYIQIVGINRKGTLVSKNT